MLAFAATLNLYAQSTKSSVYKINGPQVSQPLPTIMMEGLPPLAIFDLNDYFSHPDDEPISYSILSNSFEEVAGAYINQDIYLIIEYQSAGQTTLNIEATSNGITISSKMIVGVLPFIEGDYAVSDFESFELQPESFWNGADESGGFESGLGHFHNDYNSEFGSWSGWAYSNKTDNTTPGWFNQHSAITGQGVFSQTSEETGTYALAYNPQSLKFSNPSAHQIKGLFVTNTAYAGLSMKYGDDFSKKFGGTDGTDPDWFMLKVWGMKNGVASDSVEFYLADYRFEDNTKDYVLETWQWLELSDFGKIDSLTFQLSSSDNGDWGMNTPAYFAIDNVYIVSDLAPEVVTLPNDINLLFGNEGHSIPLTGIFTDPDDDDELIEVSVLDSYNQDLISIEMVDGNLNIIPVNNISESTEITLEALSNGKTITGSFTVTMQSTVDVVENKLSEISVHPNPASGHFRLAGINQHDVVDLELITLSGQVVLIKNNFNPSSVVETNNLAAGTYLLRIITISENLWTKVVIK